MTDDYIEKPEREEINLIDLFGTLSAFFSYSQDEKEEFQIKLNMEYDQEQNIFVCVPEVYVFVGEEHVELYDHTLNDNYLKLTSSELIDIFDVSMEFLPNFVLADQDSNTAFVETNREILRLYAAQARSSKKPLTIGLVISFVCGDLANELEMWIGHRVNDVYYKINETKIYEPFVVKDDINSDDTIEDLIDPED